MPLRFLTFIVPLLIKMFSFINRNLTIMCSSDVPGNIFGKGVAPTY